MNDLLLNWLHAFHNGSDQRITHRVSHHCYNGKYLSTFYRLAWHNNTGYMVVKHNGEWTAYVMDYTSGKLIIE